MSAGWFDNASCLERPYKMMMNEDDSSIHSKQGIVSTLSSDYFNTSSSFSNTFFNYNNSHNSIRRTLSAADMSSQKWLTPFKRVHSSLQLQALGEDQRHHDNIGDNNDHDDNNNMGSGQAFEEIWSSIQADKRTWGSILSPGNTDGSGSEPGQLPPPYVHPLAKRSTSSLTEKSLEICTESLGSETGSDGFSYPPSEPEDEQEQEQEEEEEEQEETEDKGNIVVEVGNYKCNSNNSSSLKGPTVKRSMMVLPVRPSFPPPLPSLAHRNDGSNLHIRSHRQDGRLVVEAVAVPSPNCFRAQRQDGRLLLTLSTGTDEQHHQHTEMFEAAAIKDEKYVREEVDEEDEEEEGGGDEEVLAIPREVMNVQRSCTAFTMSKLMELTNTRNKSTWPRKYNKTVIKTLDDNEEEIEDEEVDELTVTQSLPPQPRVSTATAAAVALNAYEYYWRRSNSPAAAAVAMLNPLVGHKNNIKNCAPLVEKDTKKNNNKKLLHVAHNQKGVALAQQEVVLVKAAGTETGTGRGGGGGGGATVPEKAEYLVPWMLRGCKEPKRSLLFWEPPCIATS